MNRKGPERQNNTLAVRSEKDWMMTGDGGRRGIVGRRGEEVAAAYLMAAGHTVLARNWRCGHLEIDIISMAADGIHFVEVKSRVLPMEAAPEENVGPAKRRKLLAAAGKWLERNGIYDTDCVFDIVSVVFDGDRYTVQYFPQAFIPLFM